MSNTSNVRVSAVNPSQSFIPLETNSFLSRSAGYDPIATASPASSALVKKYGAVRAVPYASPTCGETIKDITKGTLRHVIDCITTPESVGTCFKALGRVGARYASLEYAPDEWRTRKAVRMDMPMTYVVMGQEVKLTGVYHRDADLTKFELGVRWRQEVQTLLDEGRLKCHPVREIPGKWDGIVQGLDMLKTGQVRGQKLVVRIGHA